MSWTSLFLAHLGDMLCFIPREDARVRGLSGDPLCSRSQRPILVMHVPDPETWA